MPAGGGKERTRDGVGPPATAPGSHSPLAGGAAAVVRYGMLDITDLTAAQRHLAGRVHRTPVHTARTLGERFGVDLFLKVESLQRTGSFKVRGVFNRLLHLSAAERERGLITISAGNHAQAVAWAAAVEGLRATVVMPEHAVVSKVAASAAYGAEVVQHGDIFGAFEKMEELRARDGATLIHPFDDPLLIAGQGTVGLELCEDVPDLDAVIVPAGGGGLLSGVAVAVRALQPDAKVIGVEPAGAAALTAGLAAGAPVQLERVTTIADGLGAPATGVHVLEHVGRLVDDVVTVSDDAIAAALRLLLERSKLLVEPAGAAGLAALLAGAVPIHRRGGARPRVAVILSGGNIDLDRLRTLLVRAGPESGEHT
jgi:threonine dehydratase